MSETKEFELKVKDRIMLLGMLPEKGDILTLRLVIELRKELSFTEKEHQEIEIKSTNGSIVWNNAKDLPKKFAIGLVTLKLIQDALKKMNDEKTITLDHVVIYDIFMDSSKA